MRLLKRRGGGNSTPRRLTAARPTTVSMPRRRAERRTGGTARVNRGGKQGRSRESLAREGAGSAVLGRGRGRRRGDGNFIGEVTFARADLHVGYARNVHGDFAVCLGPGHILIVVRLVAQDVLRRDLTADTSHRLDDAVGDLRRVAAGAHGEGVVAVVGGVRKIAGNILV